MQFFLFNDKFFNKKRREILGYWGYPTLAENTHVAGVRIVEDDINIFGVTDPSKLTILWGECVFRMSLWVLLVVFRNWNDHILMFNNFFIQNILYSIYILRWNLNFIWNKL